jgi:hypothetical protein
MVGKTESVSRVEYLMETYEPVWKASDNPELSKEIGTEMMERNVEKEDERIWAHYRDPHTNITQLEARRRAQMSSMRTYPKRANISQATLSRKIRDMDDRMLTEPLAILNTRERREEGHVVGLLSRDNVEAMHRGRFDAILTHYGEALASFLVDVHALDMFEHSGQVTPQWARERWPDLDPDVGRELGLFNAWTPEDEIHAPKEEVDVSNHP